MALYRGMDRAQLDAAYNNRAAVPEYEEISARRRERSAQARAARAGRYDLRYGDSPRERLDFFPASGPRAPIVAFIHGGYWQTNDKEPSSFLVEGPLAHGFGVALIEYTLAPEAGIERIVGEVRRAVGWLASHAAELGGDGRVYVSGHSAGGHLTASSLDVPGVAGGLAISGLFDLEPIRLCYLNEKLRLTGESARRFSPLLHLPPRMAPLVVAVGAAELPELVRQSADYAAALLSRGLPVRYLPLAGHDHFTVLEELARPDGALCKALGELAK
jgi:acetyl esterase/lipase